MKSIRLVAREVRYFLDSNNVQWGTEAEAMLSSAMIKLEEFCEDISNRSRTDDIELGKELSNSAILAGLHSAITRSMEEIKSLEERHELIGKVLERPALERSEEEPSKNDAVTFTKDEIEHIVKEAILMGDKEGSLKVTRERFIYDLLHRSDKMKRLWES